MKILIASSLKNLERLQSYLLPDAEKGLRLFTANNKLQLRFGKNGKAIHYSSIFVTGLLVQQHKGEQ